MPKRETACDVVPVPSMDSYAQFALKADGKEMSTTMAFVRMLGNLLKDGKLGPRIVPIVADEARTFLSMPHPEPDRPHGGERKSPAPTGSPEAARRLFAMARPIGRTLVETYLRNRAITALHETGALRFHPYCYYRADENAPTETWPTRWK